MVLSILNRSHLIGYCEATLLPISVLMFQTECELKTNGSSVIQRTRNYYEKPVKLCKRQATGKDTWVTFRQLLERQKQRSM